MSLRCVALFRGINVGRAKRIAMGDLRDLLEDLGFSDVCTLLNSGNAVFTARSGASARIAGRIRAAVHTRLGVDAFVIVKSVAEIGAVISENALAHVATDGSKLLIAMTADAAALAALRTRAARDWGREKVHVNEHALYLWCANGILESEAGKTLLGCLGESGTTRNWNTLLKIHALMVPS